MDMSIDLSIEICKSEKQFKLDLKTAGSEQWFSSFFFWVDKNSMAWEQKLLHINIRWSGSFWWEETFSELLSKDSRFIQFKIHS